MRSSRILIPVFIVFIVVAIGSLFYRLFNFKDNMIDSVAGIIVNHHLLAPGLIERTLSKIDVNTKNIVLISPDHFNINPSRITSPDIATSEFLNTKYEPRLNEIEHGITNIVPYIHRYAPNAKIFSIAVGESLGLQIPSSLTDKLIAMEDVVFILSSDMSHGLDHRAAYFHDTYTFDVIKNIDFAAAGGVETDSKNGLGLFLKIMKGRGAEKFNLVERTDSASIVVSPTTGENTSYIAGYFSNEKATIDPDRPVNIFACGDMMFDRDVRKYIDKYGFDSIFKKYSRLFDGSDISLVNLEGPITSASSEATETKLKFTFDLAVAKKIKELGIDFVSLANNHTFNFGNSGFMETKEALSKAGVAFFGHPDNTDDSFVIKKIKNKRVAFVGYHQFSYQSLDMAVKIIERVKNEADIIIVMAHWGNEYEVSPSQRQRSEARRIIDAGANIIIGSHPHVIQPIEIYKNRPIFYSLGNCMFDQYFSPLTKQGLSIGLSIYDHKTEVVLMPIGNTPYNFGLLNYSESDIIISNIASTSFIDQSIKDNMRGGIFKIP